MKLLVSLIFTLFMYHSLTGQEIAITERGDTVYLYSNGMWDYYGDNKDAKSKSTKIRINNNLFEKLSSSSSKITGTRPTYEIWFDKKKWKRIPVGQLNPDADVAFQLIDGEAYAMIINEEVEIELESLTDIAFENALLVSSDLRMIDREYRIVNGDTLVWMRMDGTMGGVKASYYSYYFSGKSGSIQFHTFTGQNMIDRYKEDLEEMLNGLVILKK